VDHVQRLDLDIARRLVLDPPAQLGDPHQRRQHHRQHAAEDRPGPGGLGSERQCPQTPSGGGAVNTRRSSSSRTERPESPTRGPNGACRDPTTTGPAPDAGPGRCPSRNSADEVLVDRDRPGWIRFEPGRPRPDAAPRQGRPAATTSTSWTPASSARSSPRSSRTSSARPTSTVSKAVDAQSAGTRRHAPLQPSPLANDGGAAKRPGVAVHDPIAGLLAHGALRQPATTAAATTPSRG